MAITLNLNEVTGGIAVVAILILAGLGFAFWRAALAAYKRVVATTKTGGVT